MSEVEPVSQEELRALCEFLYRRTGMVFTEAKRYYVQRRISDRMNALGIAPFRTYFARLRSDVDGEVEQFINAFTVNETYFYREDHQLRCLSSDLLNERVRAKRPGEALRIWSVPCATGEEPYSIAIWLLENWPEVDVQDIEIIGSDIDTQCTAAAAEGEYGTRALMRLSPQLVEKYFVPAGKDRWRVVPELRQSVQFSSANITKASETRQHGIFDVIFCRNVLIYFDDASRRVAAENLFEALAPGGFICLGHTESMSRISPLFEVRRFADAIVYQRPLAGGNGGRSMAETASKRILVVDDASLVRRYYRDALERAGFEVDEALNGVEALEKLLAEPADLLIVDVNMPQMDGFTFLRSLRQQAPPIASIPALVISTEAGPHDRRAARSAGANFYLVKPVAQDALVQHVAIMCGLPA